MPRCTTRSIASSRVADMPTSTAGLTGRPSPALVTVSAVRMTLSNSNSLNYGNLYCRSARKFPSPRKGETGALRMERGRTVADDSGNEKGTGNVGGNTNPCAGDEESIRSDHRRDGT